MALISTPALLLPVAAPSCITIRRSTHRCQQRRRCCQTLAAQARDPSAAGVVRSADGLSNSRRSLLLAGVATTFLQWKVGPSAAEQGELLNGAALEAVEKALKSAIPPTKAPAVLRCVFHDAGTYDVAAENGGANASLRYETSRPENKGIKRGLNCVTEAMNKLSGTEAEGKVSYADMIALAGAYAVSLTGGPKISVPVGRADAVEADPEGRLPAETLTADELKASFASKGISCQELVALSGSHTIGGKGFGEALVFDNAYYKALLAKPWKDPSVEMGNMIGLPSDHVLPEDEECLEFIKMYAEDQELFFVDFSKALLKLTMSGAKWT